MELVDVTSCSPTRPIQAPRKHWNHLQIATPSKLKSAYSVSCSLTDNAKASRHEIDVVILSNGPGEVSTWVKSIVRNIRSKMEENNGVLRISLVLAPCPHASGREWELASSFPEIDRCQPPEHFFRFLSLGITAENWQWREKGLCVFLGGEQLYSTIIGRSLGYPTLMYIEEAIHWPGLADFYALRHSSLLSQVPFWAKDKCRVVGDLFYSGMSQNGGSLVLEGAARPVIGLLPGSKPVKLALGLPFFMAAADKIHSLLNGKVDFIIPLAPTVSTTDLEQYINPDRNVYISRLGWAAGKFVPCEGPSPDNGLVGYLVSKAGTEIRLYKQFPVYDLYQECAICLTTVGTNTAELGHLAVPMIVVLPTQVLEIFSSVSGGVLGLLTRLPGSLGIWVLKSLNRAYLEQAGFLSWPNKWAGRMVVPELVGEVEPAEVAELAVDLLTSEKGLSGMRAALVDLMLESEVGKLPDPADSIVEEIKALLGR